MTNSEAILARVSCRKYTDTPLSEQELLQRADKVVYNDGSRSLIGQLWQLLSNM